jgi:predicted phage terminase large subunit-like protein
MKAEWFRRYTDLPKNEADAQGIVRTVIKRTTISVDTASKTNERNDYTAITVWVETFDGNHYLADVVRERLEYKPMEELIEATAKKWVADAILVEDKGSGIQYIQNRAGKAPAPVIPIKVSIESKQFRFDGVTPMFEAGNVFIPTNGLWVPDYERELLDFPNGSFDDQVDSTSQYLNWIKSRRPGGTKKLQGTGYGSRTHEDVEALAQEALRQKVGPSGRIGG